MKAANGRSFLLDFLAVFLLTAVLIAPLFRLKYLDNWASIESTFISDARMLSENLPQQSWQPLWYCGTRWDYIYPPALRYGTALIAKLIHSTTARSYHLYCALIYCLGIAGVYAFVRVGSGSRRWAWVAAAGAALLSPSFLVLKDFRGDVRYWEPQRFLSLIHI